MLRKKTSILWTTNVDQLRKIVSESNSFASIFKYFGIPCTGAGYKALKKRLAEVNVSYDHIRLGPDCNKGRKFLVTKAYPLGRVMVEGSTYSRCHLKRRLLLNGSLNNVCGICGQEPLWNGQQMTLVLDHINGKRDDHRMENLRLVCPNCNSQLATTGGNANRRRRNCIKCGVVISQRHAKYCRECRPKTQRGCRQSNEPNSSHKYERSPREYKDGLAFPSKDSLEQLVREMPMSAIGKKYGVSDNAVKKWCKRYGILIGGMRGFWQKKRSRGVVTQTQLAS